MRHSAYSASLKRKDIGDEFAHEIEVASNFGLCRMRTVLPSDLSVASGAGATALGEISNFKIFCEEKAN